MLLGMNGLRPINKRRGSGFETCRGPKIVTKVALMYHQTVIVIHAAGSR
jgi:hypothetical protein